MPGWWGRRESGVNVTHHLSLRPTRRRRHRARGERSRSGLPGASRAVETKDRKTAKCRGGLLPRQSTWLRGRCVQIRASSRRDQKWVKSSPVGVSHSMIEQPVHESACKIRCTHDRRAVPVHLLLAHDGAPGTKCRRARDRGEPQGAVCTRRVSVSDITPRPLGSARGQGGDVGVAAAAGRANPAPGRGHIGVRLGRAQQGGARTPVGVGQPRRDRHAKSHDRDAGARQFPRCGSVRSCTSRSSRSSRPPIRRRRSCRATSTRTTSRSRPPGTRRGTHSRRCTCSSVACSAAASSYRSATSRASCRASRRPRPISSSCASSSARAGAPAHPDPDAMAYIDDIIALDQAYTDALRRPHQLFLGGDQIYADDVSGAAHAGADAGGHRAGRRHRHRPPTRSSGSALDAVLQRNPAATPTPDDPLIAYPADVALASEADRQLPADRAHFPEGRRLHLTLRAAQMTSNDGDSHLISFGEFAAMYLSVWSTAVWDRRCRLPSSGTIPIARAPPGPWRGRTCCPAGRSSCPTPSSRPHPQAPVYRSDRADRRRAAALEAVRARTPEQRAAAAREARREDAPGREPARAAPRAAARAAQGAAGARQRPDLHDPRRPRASPTTAS